ncbi:myelin transcription factor 1-like protein [Cocos nucifera]|uniref:Myelin transcription factor 1-like protein n=1 Tax=Cocos nucifera TaxID=13894 RepID=A0A8K0IL36_COCNU|nr:myelin transcription factor 1-like protein [Cocos nucifera]
MEGDEASSPEISSPEEGRDEGISEYERQRLSRIKENRARLEALGLPRLASSLIGSLSEHRRPGEEGKEKKKAKKRKGVGRSSVDDEDDDEYRPSDEYKEEEEDGESSSSSEEKKEKDKRPPSGSRRKGKKRNSLNATKAGKSLDGEGDMKNSDDFIDDDVAIKKAIALSLGEVMEESGIAGFSQNSGTNIADSGPRGKKDKTSLQETVGKRKNKKLSKSRVQLSEDEVVAYFFSFDEVGKGHITVWDLQRMAMAHDFTWTDSEVANMIHCFDSNGDGKLSLDDFRAIVSRCNMMQELGEC